LAGRRFKAKFNHEGGGIDIVEIAAVHSEEIVRTRNIADAERFSLLPQLSAAVRAQAA
jgi:hypothetical protein